MNREFNFASWHVFILILSCLYVWQIPCKDAFKGDTEIIKLLPLLTSNKSVTLGIIKEFCWFVSIMTF